MLLKADRSALLVVDVQARLAPHVLDHEELIERCGWLMDVAAELEVPSLVSEHYPEGIGATVPALAGRAPAGATMRKVHFSCMAEPGCRSRLDSLGREQIVVAGMEAHVCVMQTVLDLLAGGREVYVVEEAVSSRRARDRSLALERMRDGGARLVSPEMVLFEWAERGGDDRFRRLHRRFLKPG